MDSPDYKWDCMAVAIYFGEKEIIEILEEHNIEKGCHISHIEAAALSYRNLIVKEIINNFRENEKFKIFSQSIQLFLNTGLIESVKNNNIKGIWLINNGANINAKTNESDTLGDRGGKTPLHIALEKNSKENY